MVMVMVMVAEHNRPGSVPSPHKASSQSLLARLSIAFQAIDGDGDAGYHVLFLDEVNKIGLEDKSGTMILDFSDEALLENAELSKADVRLLKQHRKDVVGYVTHKGYMVLMDDADLPEALSLRRCPMNQVAFGLACCIERARCLADGDDTSTSEVYWYTREAVMKIARTNGIRAQDVLYLLYKAQFQTDDSVGAWFQTVSGYNIRISQEVIGPSEKYWSDVVHPRVLIQEVMEA